ncbi:YopX family protein [Bacillus sp. AFS040349]|uniref:YopX family protein n=1 Tax=Bacillus sp. AFS040349 TaxID=2033502 RepID=UPI000BFBF47E|nr:YopX family protein [Bacillus sp. AFS040349]PGT89198.1 hypothetical protein COD11_04145 [Bacillus sp. AFS040349]
MREIKFRAFIKNIKWLLPVITIDFDKDNGFVEVDLSGEGDYADYTFDEVDLMQYTGFKDINEHEVYEGDIVEVKWLKDTDKGVVRWFACGFYVMDMEWHSPIPLSSMSAKIEVVGNVHEIQLLRRDEE